VRFTSSTSGQSHRTDPLRPAEPANPDPLQPPAADKQVFPEIPADVRATLDEFDFFATQGLCLDAQQLLSEIPEEFQAHPEVIARRVGTSTVDDEPKGQP
jgi:hypothetical protein